MLSDQSSSILFGSDFVPLNRAIHVSSVTKSKRGISEFEKLLRSIKRKTPQPLDLIRTGD